MPGGATSRTSGTTRRQSRVMRRLTRTGQKFPACFTRSKTSPRARSMSARPTTSTSSDGWPSTLRASRSSTLRLTTTSSQKTSCQSSGSAVSRETLRLQKRWSTSPAAVLLPTTWLLSTRPWRGPRTRFASSPSPGGTTMQSASRASADLTRTWYLWPSSATRESCLNAPSTWRRGRCTSRQSSCTRMEETALERCSSASTPNCSTPSEQSPTTWEATPTRSSCARSAISSCRTPSTTRLSSCLSRASSPSKRWSSVRSTRWR
mmetsp:Transcript_29993/g.67851  ORF Transcript_29993/g.67851 Transcript_29993/m.67851 type:complete len:263 (+) Transcript_29993:500-1288(+)